MEENNLVGYATQLKADPRLLHLLVATAKQSNSPVIRYGAVALDEEGNVAGTGYSKMAETEAEKRWGDEHTPPRLHAEMNALCNAESNGYDVSRLELYILPLSPADNPAKPAGYIMLRDMEHTPCFSCSSCGPKLEKLGIEVNVFNGERGWETISPEQAKRDGERLAELERETGRRCRAGSIPGSIITEPPLDIAGYRYIPALLSDMDDIGFSISPEQHARYEQASAAHDLPVTMQGDISHLGRKPRGDIALG
ncbi:MAG: hypothetical protein CMM94_06605 [Rickettsiales bacterium]|nr:hypothetical protein [Rickettsiales bacterium]